MRNKFQAAAAALLALGYVGSASAADPISLSFEGEALWLNRGDPEGKALAFDDDGPDTGEVLMEFGDLGSGYDSGTRLTFGLHSGPHHFEVVYAGLTDWEADARQQGSGGEHGDPDFDTFLEEEGQDVAPFTFVDDCCIVNDEAPFENVRAANAAFDSEFDSFEFNYRHDLPTWLQIESSVLAGFRWVRVDENFGFLTDHQRLGPNFPGFAEGLIACCGSNPPLDDFGRYILAIENDLYGVQFGWIGAHGFGVSLPGLGDGTVRVGAKFKAGMFGNKAEQDSKLIIFGYEARGGSKNESTFATVVEAGLQLALEFHNVAITFGYEVIQANGLALAEENLPQAIGRNTFDDLDTSGSVRYHGPSLGVRVAFDAGSIKMPKLFP